MSDRRRVPAQPTPLRNSLFGREIVFDGARQQRGHGFFRDGPRHTLRPQLGLKASRPAWTPRQPVFDPDAREPGIVEPPGPSEFRAHRKDRLGRHLASLQRAFEFDATSEPPLQQPERDVARFLPDGRLLNMRQRSCVQQASGFNAQPPGGVRIQTERTSAFDDHSPDERVACERRDPEDPRSILLG
jgi:hypothetical protein